MTTTPKFKHPPCDQCTFLGGDEVEDNYYDFYYCNQLMFSPTVIARFSDVEPDYFSGMAIAETGEFPPLTEALRRAKAQGLIQPKEGDTDV